jgi:DNA-3-methyladenine glycosylase II
MSRRILAQLATADPVLGGLIRAVGPCRLERQAECHPFQVLAQAIAHQQLNGTAANTILGRLVQSCGQGAFPTPEQVLAASVESLRAAGFSFAKVAALRDLAEKTLTAVVPGRSALEQLADAEIIERLTEVRGVGRWTVEMLLIFQLGRPDVLPVDDFGVRSGFRAAYGLARLPRPRALAAWGERWKPYRSIAAWYLWRALELERAGKLPEPPQRISLPRVRRRRRRAARPAPGRRRVARKPARAAARRAAVQRAAARRAKGSNRAPRSGRARARRSTRNS